MRGIIFVLLACFAAECADIAEPIQLIQAGRFRDAATEIRRSLKRAPQDPELWNLLGICESELNDTPAARTAFQRGLAVAPDSAGLNENAGLFYFREADYASAKRHLSRAVELGSSNPGAAYSLAAARIRLGERLDGLAELKKLEGQLAGKSEYWAERGWSELPDNARAAAVSFERALQLTATDVRALNGAASAAEKLQDDERALSYLLRAKTAQPGDLRTLLHLATVCLRRDLSVDARAAATEARRLAPENNLALFLLARSEIAFQQWQKSHELFSEFDRRVPGYAPAQYALGWLDIRLNRNAEARQHLRRAPQIPDAQYELAQMDLAESHLDEARKRLEAILAADPDHVKAHVALGDVFLKRGNPAGAKTEYERAIVVDPRSGPAHYKLSMALMRLNETEQADKERAIGAELNADSTRKAKTVLVLANPDGSLLTGEPGGEK